MITCSELTCAKRLSVASSLALRSPDKLVALPWLVAALTACSAAPAAHEVVASAPQPEAPASASAAAALPPAAAPAQAAEWRVGAYLCLSGPEASFGVDTKEGIDLAVEETNTAGIKGRPLKMFYADDRSNPQTATDEVLNLIHRDNVIALLGEVASSRAKAGGIVADKLQVPMIAIAATNPEVTRVGPFVFRACFIDDVQARAAARYLVKTRKKKRFAILFASDALYSSTLATEFKAEATRLGATIVSEQSFLQTETNFASRLAALRGAKADFIYAPVYYNHMIPIARQAKAAGIAGRSFVGGDGWEAEELLKDASAELEGAMLTSHWVSDAPDPVSRAFVTHYHARFHRDATSLAALGYDAARLLADALGRAREPTPAAVRDAIAETRGFVGATGRLSMGADRDPDKPVFVVKIAKGRFTYGDAVSPAP